MPIIQALLFIFVVNTSCPNPNLAYSSLSKALVNNWRLVEVSQKGIGKTKYDHPRMTYKFNKDGSGMILFKKDIENFTWRVEGSYLFIKVDETNIEIKAKVYFVNSTRVARKKIKAYNKGKNGALLFIEAMPVYSK